MKFTILKENLKEGLNILEKILVKNLTLPILNNVKLETEKSLVKLSATNLEIGINFWSLAKIEKEGKILLPLKFFSNLINNLQSQKISFEDQNLILKLVNEKYQVQIKGYNPEDYPIIPEIKNIIPFEVETAVFIDNLKQVVDFAALSQFKPEISGILLNFNKENIKMVATDSFRLAEKKMPLNQKNTVIEKEVSIILPQKTAYELIYIFSDKKEKLRIYLGQNQIMFECLMEQFKHPKIQVISRLIEEKFPDYQEIIPKSYLTKITTPKDEIVNQIKIASLFCGKVNDIKIRTEPKSQVLEIFSQNQDIGENKSQITIKVEGEKQEVSFNYKFLLDGLQNLKSSEVILELNKEVGPTVIKPVGDDSYIYLVMPIKTT